MSYDRNIGNAAPTSFEMKKTITTVTAKFVLVVEGQKMKREVVWPNKKAEYKND